MGKSTNASSTLASVCVSGVARAIRVLKAVVNVRLPPDMMVRQGSSTGNLSAAVDTGSLSSLGTASPQAGTAQPANGRKHNSMQVLTAHDNGQVQVWDMSTGFLQPVLRMGLAGPSARCGLAATSHC